jgi:hypothetical protein
MFWVAFADVIPRATIQCEIRKLGDQIVNAVFVDVELDQIIRAIRDVAAHVCQTAVPIGEPHRETGIYS